MALSTLTLPTSWGAVQLSGGSRAGEGTLLVLPQFRLALDIGRAHRILPPVTTACLSHGHVDHLGGLAYWASQRFLNSLGPATLCVPDEVVAEIGELLAVHARLEGGKPYDINLKAVSDGDIHTLKKNCHLEFFSTDHWIPTLGSRILWTRKRLLPELGDAEPAELAAMRTAGTPITSDVVTPLVSYGADTGPGLFTNDRALDAEILLLECSFWGEGDIERARAYGHLHISDLLEHVSRFKCRHLVLLHASRRNRLHEVERIMASELAPVFDGELHHLMIDWE